MEENKSLTSSNSTFFSKALLYLFYLFLIYKLIKFVLWIYNHLPIHLKKLPQKYKAGSYVFITGASDGIGKQFALLFASLGFNLILVSRTESKLTSVKNEIQSKFSKCLIEIIPFDFNKQTQLTDYEKTFNKYINSFDISILVNNVGSFDLNYFAEIPIEKVNEMVNLNCLPQAILTRLILPKLKERKTASAIIDISSFAASYPIPFYNMYSATKIFSEYLNVAIREENLGSNVDFLLVQPLEVESNMSRVEADGIICLRPEQCAKGTLNLLGRVNKTTGHWIHDIQAEIINAVPLFIKLKMKNLILKEFQTKRAAYKSKSE